MSTSAQDLVTVTLNRTYGFYASTVYAKFRAQDELRIEANSNAIPRAVEIVHKLNEKGDAVIVKAGTRNLQRGYRMHVHGIYFRLAKTQQLADRLEQDPSSKENQEEQEEEKQPAE